MFNGKRIKNNFIKKMTKGYWNPNALKKDTYKFNKEYQEPITINELSKLKDIKYINGTRSSGFNGGHKGALKAVKKMMDFVFLDSSYRVFLNSNIEKEDLERYLQWVEDEFIKKMPLDEFLKYFIIWGRPYVEADSDYLRVNPAFRKIKWAYDNIMDSDIIDDRIKYNIKRLYGKGGSYTLDNLLESEDYDYPYGEAIIGEIYNSVNGGINGKNVINGKWKINVNEILDNVFSDDEEEYRGKHHWQRVTDGEILSEVGEQLVNEMADEFMIKGPFVMILFKKFLIELSKVSKNDKKQMNNFVKELRLLISEKIKKTNNEDFFKLF